ncbi:hypothetical protein GO013_04895 [Pseudodesulfovibrio sp. JC047]|uniref:hypothetical protein n=1 Tax=Pseudodesulfovibrio sp. JC047 TaxID=2683199 RepID=UPI0013D4C24A|nr:hypothetical protein [Pseudodesulfovibrio sp. JC047]NDV18755.1 hypothetical protein [Pseudodesulfovibrio sp. JC047]
MPEFPIHYGQIEVNDPGINRVISIALSGLMLFPKEKDKHKLGHYKARCLLQSVPFLIDHGGYSKERAGSVLVPLVEESFGTWENFMFFLLSKRIPGEGKGSLQSFAHQGYIAGMIFLEVFVNRVGLKEAVEKIIDSAKEQKMLEEFGTSAENLINNVWASWKPVAHLWAALTWYEMPEPDDSYIALDRIVPKQGSPSSLAEGLMGFLELAQYYYDYSVEHKIKFKQSSRVLVDSERAWNVVFIR